MENEMSALIIKKEIKFIIEFVHSFICPKKSLFKSKISIKKIHRFTCILLYIFTKIKFLFQINQIA